MIRTKGILLVMITATVLTAPQTSLLGVGLGHSANPQADSIPTVRLRLQPQAEPRPALRYRFDTPYLDQHRGNAALLYDTAFSAVVNAESHPKFDEQKLRDWQEMPPTELPLDEIRGVLPLFEKAIEYAELAGRCESCQWEEPVREMGWGTLIPMLSEARLLGRVIALKAKVQAIEGNSDQALQTLRTGLSLAHNLGKGPWFIRSLVGLGIATNMADSIEFLVQTPQAPNLYWAIASLDQPLVDIRQAVQGEAESLYIAFPELRELDEHPLSNDDVMELWMRMAQMDIGSPSEGSSRGIAIPVTEALKFYPAAKQWLREQGLSTEAIDAMAPLYAVLRYEHYHFTCLRDDMTKWFSVPYWEAAGDFEKAQKRVTEAVRQAQPGGTLATMSAASGRIAYQGALIERDLAILRCVEAIRIYGAAHNKQLPPSLDAITEVPVPVDPLYGRPFAYEFHNDSATLESLAPAGQRARDSIRYEIVFK